MYNNMKTIIHITTYILLLAGLYGCNSDVFIDDFQPSVSEMILDGNGDSVSIQFNSSNWDWLGVYNDIHNDINYYKMYDTDGNFVEERSFLVGLGKIVYDDGITMFTVERTHPKELKITVDKNLYSSLFRFKLIPSNEFESKEIDVTISSSDRYVFDHISYSLNAYYTDQQVKIKESFAVNNNGGDIVSHKMFPYKDECRSVTFTSADPEAFLLLADHNLKVEIPSFSAGSLIMNGEQAQYISEPQELPLPFSDTEQKDVIIQPYSYQRITLILEYEWFETEFTLYATHPKTKEQRIITGTMQSKMPKRYYLKRENLND